jgi:hypothetical protein
LIAASCCSAENGSPSANCFLPASNVRQKKSLYQKFTASGSLEHFTF